MFKNTKTLQLQSLIAFANHLGFYLMNTESMGLVFADERHYKVSVNSMINYHNGNFHISNRFAGNREYGQFLSRKLGKHVSTAELTKAYEQTLVFNVKYRYSKKTRLLTAQHDYDNIVELKPGVNLNRY